MPVLFEGSVKDNLLLGKPDATEEEIIAATKAANAHDFISKLSNGYGKFITWGALAQDEHRKYFIYFVLHKTLLTN